MTFIADSLELVVQLAHALGGLDVGWVLFFVAGGLVACDKAEQFDVLVEFFDGEFLLGIFLQVVKAKSSKIGNQNVTR